jgi:DNA-binding NtrC family response regulator
VGLSEQKHSFAKRLRMDSILVVEDEELILGLVTEVLEMYGYRVTPFKSADDAWSFIERCGYPPRLLITDLQMPGEIDGIELVKRVQQAQPLTPVVVASGYHSSAETLVDLPVIWLPKPFDIDELHEVCRKLAPQC